MVKKLGIAQLKAHLAEALREVEAGDRIAIERRGRTVAMLVPPSDAAIAEEDWWTQIHGIASHVDDFESIMRATVRSRRTSRPRPVDLED